MDIPSENLPDISNQFGRYQLLDRLGDGGMARVFKAEMVGLGGFSKLVALKVMHPHLGMQEEFVNGFIGEARLGGFLKHPNIVETLDFGVQEDRLFLAMELVEGVTLRTLQKLHQERQSPMPLEIVLQLLIDVCEGLHHAHTAVDREGRPLAMVHRDLKPSNILLGKHGEVKLSDFGVARASSNLTQTMHSGVLKGTPYYMSPEQAWGELQIDHRSDLFSVGLILYELLCQEHLYLGKNREVIIRCAQDADVGHRLERIPESPWRADLVTLLSRVLDREPDARHVSAQALAHDMKVVLERIPRRIQLKDWLIQATRNAMALEGARLLNESPLTPDRLGLTPEWGQKSQGETFPRAPRGPAPSTTGTEFMSHVPARSPAHSLLSFDGALASDGAMSLSPRPSVPLPSAKTSGWPASAFSTEAGTPVPTTLPAAPRRPSSQAISGAPRSNLQPNLANAEPEVPGSRPGNISQRPPSDGATPPPTFVGQRIQPDAVAPPPTIVGQRSPQDHNSPPPTIVGQRPPQDPAASPPPIVTQRPPQDHVSPPPTIVGQRPPQVQDSPPSTIVGPRTTQAQTVSPDKEDSEQSFRRPSSLTRNLALGGGAVLALVLVLTFWPSEKGETGPHAGSNEGSAGVDGKTSATYTTPDERNTVASKPGQPPVGETGSEKNISMAETDAGPGSSTTPEKDKSKSSATSTSTASKTATTNTAKTNTAPTNTATTTKAQPPSSTTSAPPQKGSSGSGASSAAVAQSTGQAGSSGAAETSGTGGSSGAAGTAGVGGSTGVAGTSGAGTSGTAGASTKVAGPHGLLMLNSKPVADVYLNGKWIARTPVQDLEVPPGVHEIVFKDNSGARLRENAFKVDAGQTIRCTAYFQSRELKCK